MSYSRGVFIHNFNEDQFGSDLKRSPRDPAAPLCSTSHASFCAKRPTLGMPTQDSALGAMGIDQHIFFGHSGDMRNPHITLQKRGFVTSHEYFMKDPATTKPGSLTADGFTLATEAPAVQSDVLFQTDLPIHAKESPLAVKIRQGWMDGRQTLAMHPDDRFLTETKKSFSRPPVETTCFQRYPKEYGEFSRGMDMGQCGGPGPRRARAGASTPRNTSIRATGNMVVR
eukprot:TRINITY_DN12435_c0_g1_i1.p1 TRINITY_DN12435_c0_g1~~TRINITY_DN12435_c0_g1_i1.p1  ORF type:complete len:227 (+),score=22.62 TRINITY_DN12435_c0_g1_i1:235-915(+)